MTRGRLALPLLLLAVLVGGIAAAWWILGEFAPQRADAALPQAPTRDSAQADAIRVERTAAETTDRSNDSTIATAVSDEPLFVFPATRAHADFVLVVEDRAGRPQANARVRMSSDLGGFPQELPIGDDRGEWMDVRTDPRGRVERPSLAEGPYFVEACADDGRRGEARFVFRAKEADEPLRLVLDDVARRAGLTIRVVDTARTAVAGAMAEFYGALHDPGVARGRLFAPMGGVTDAEGRLFFPNVKASRGVVIARAHDGRVGQAPVNGDDECTVVIDAAATLAGNLVGVDATKLTGASVHVELRTQTLPYWWTWGRSIASAVVGDRFEISELPAGDAMLVLDAPAGARMVLKKLDFCGVLENSVTPLAVKLIAGKRTEIEVPVAAGGTILGRVHRADGSAVAHATISDVYAPLTSNFPDGFVLHGVNVWRFDQDNTIAADHPLTHVTTRTDDLGNYRLAGLQPGRHRITVHAPGLTFDRREGVAVEDGATVGLDHALAPAGVLQGLAPTSGYVGITPVGAMEPLAIAILPASRAFTFPGLAGGEYVLAQFHSDANVAPVEFARATVVAGRTTWLDLSDAPGPVEIAGRLLDRSGPVVGASVSLFGRPARVDANGAFALHEFFQWTGRICFDVEIERVVYHFRNRRLEGAIGWHGDLQLGGDELELIALRADGSPATATLTLQREVPDDQQHEVTALETRPIATDAHGRAKIAGLLYGTYQLTVSFDDGVRVETRCDVPLREPLVVTAPAAGEVEVHVVDADGKPVANWQVSAATWLGSSELPEDLAALEGHDELFAWIRGGTDANGVALLHGVRAGTAIVRTHGPQWDAVDQTPRLPAPRRVVVAPRERSMVTLQLDASLPRE